MLLERQNFEWEQTEDQADNRQNSELRYF